MFSPYLNRILLSSFSRLANNWFSVEEVRLVVLSAFLSVCLYFSCSIAPILFGRRCEYLCRWGVWCLWIQKRALSVPNITCLPWIKIRTRSGDSQSVCLLVRWSVEKWKNSFDFKCWFLVGRFWQLTLGNRWYHFCDRNWQRGDGGDGELKEN